MARPVPEQKEPLPHAGERRSDDVFRWITSLILAGELRPGQRLPSERQLSSALGVSRSALREVARDGIPDRLGAPGRCIREMEACLAADAAETAARYEEADWAFHLTVAEMKGNRLYLHMFLLLRQLVCQSVTLSRRVVPGDYLRENAKRHREIHDALARRNPDAAERSMMRHFELLEAHIARKEQAS